MRTVLTLPALLALSLWAPGRPPPCEVPAAAPHTAESFRAELAKLSAGGDLEPDDGVRGARPGLPDRRLYPPVPLAKVAAHDGWARPRALLAGKVTYLKHEDDGDTHFVVEDGTSRVVCEIVPELPLPHPRVGQSVEVWGIPRWDGEHRWGELHPVVGWVQAPKADAPKADPAPAPPLKITGETTVPAYKLVRLAAENADPAAALLWDVYPDAADVEELGDRVLFAGPPGVYTVKLRSVSFGAGKPTRTVTVKVTVTVQGTTPPAPGPDPGPGPAPADPFAAAVRAAYLAEPAADKAKSVAALAGLYRTAAGSTSLDPTVQTVGDLFHDLTIASRALLPEAAVPGVRKAVGARLSAALGTNPAAPVDRAKAAVEFSAVAAALEGASK